MKITVVTVCFNSAATIADTLRSLDDQTWPDIEHIVIDGGSTDDTLRILGEHARPWRQVRSEPYRGIYDAMNKGLRAATGEVVGMLNSDNFFSSSDALPSVATLDPVSGRPFLVGAGLRLIRRCMCAGASTRRLANLIWPTRSQRTWT